MIHVTKLYDLYDKSTAKTLLECHVYSVTKLRER